MRGKQHLGLFPDLNTSMRVPFPEMMGKWTKLEAGGWLQWEGGGEQLSGVEKVTWFKRLWIQVGGGVCCAFARQT